MFTNTAATAISTYKVYLSRCWLCTVSTTATIAADYYYDIGSSYISINYGAWTNDFASDCGAVTLTITYGSNSSVVPTSGFAITQDTSANQLRVYTTSTTLAGSYKVDFSGQAGTYNIWLNESTTVHLLIPCTLSVGSSDFPAKTYTVNSQPVLTYQFTGFTPSNCLNSTIAYSVTYDGSNTAPAWASYDNITNNFTIDPKTNSYKGSHVIKVTGTIYEQVTNRYYSTTGTWSITILPENTSPPVMNQPTDQTVKTGTTSKYSLPSISDPDGDGWSVSTNMGSAASFIQYSSGTFTIAPTIANTGTFTISVTLTDNNPVPLSSQYSFTVTVTSSTTSKSSSSNSTNSTSNSTSTFAGVVITALSANATSAEKAVWE